jgi:hypothetical protein
MNMFKYNHTIAAGIAAAMLLGAACAAPDDTTARDTAGQVQVTGSPRGISSFVAERGPLGLLRDEPAAHAFAAASAGAAPARLSIYQLAAVPPAEQLVSLRAGELAMAGAAIHRGAPAVDAAAFPAPFEPNVYAHKGALKLRINAYSGAELFADSSRFHRSSGVVTLPFAESTYVDTALQYVSRSGGLGRTGVGPGSLYPYKVRRYMNAGTATGAPAVSTTYQVSVAFNQSIDDVPVIGPGSKFVVHLSPDGAVVGHEQNLRAVSRQLAVIGASDLVAPEDARRDVERRLRARGVDLDGYVATRSELGYLRLGRDSIQSVVTPHYLFVYEPKPGVLGKQLVEVAPVTRNPAHLAMLAADDKQEQARKATMRAAIQPTEKGAETNEVEPRTEKLWPTGVSPE